MSLHANPLLYLNMGGEMLYILQERLKAQRIAIDKSVRVLDEVSARILDTQIVSRLFEQSAPIDLSTIRSTLERAALSSIMRLDERSMNKLFDLMIMMVKYQIQMATGPRELLLMTLNHIDSMRDTIMDHSNADRHQSRFVLVHRMLLRLYGNLTYEEMWQVRQACLIKLDNYNVRVSILLRLRMQREDGSFVPCRTSHSYNERYEEHREDSRNLRLLENSCRECNVGSLRLIGDRVTFLGTNVYSSSVYGNSENSVSTLHLTKDEGRADSRAEFGMLAIQLGSCCEDASYSAASSSQNQSGRPFTLRLFSENEIIQTEKLYNTRDDNCTRKNVVDSAAFVNNLKHEDNRDEGELGDEDTAGADEPALNNQYKAQLDNIYTELVIEEEKETSVSRQMELLELIDQLE